MKSNFTKKIITFSASICLIFLVLNCSSDSDGGTTSITIDGSFTHFGNVTVSEHSNSQSILIQGTSVTDVVRISVTPDFEVSTNDIDFFSEVNVSSNDANGGNTNVYVRFSPSATGTLKGTLSVQNAGTETQTLNLIGNGLAPIHNYVTFNNQRIAFGGGFNQTETATFNLHQDITNIETIKMYVKLRCPAGGCNAWDVYANIKVKDEATNDWFEIGRYITPYGVDNARLARGFEIDVTDFKSLLTGSTELFARIETWGADGWELSVDFDYIEGEPDFQHYAVAKVMGYDQWSTSGVPYGVAHSFDLTKSVSIPSNAESTHLRTIISGWGHATPVDSDNRPCAEWCFRTHDVLIDGSTAFQHNMQPIGCGSNPIQPQNGNWEPDRAGWCPGMAVPVRTDTFGTSMAGTTFSFEYAYENWVADGGSTSGNAGAYYATSTFVIVKSNTPISAPTVAD